MLSQSVSQGLETLLHPYTGSCDIGHCKVDFICYGLSIIVYVWAFSDDLNVLYQ